MTSKSKPVIPEHILASSSCPLGESDERIGLALADISACDKGSNPAQVIGVSHDEGIPRKARIPIKAFNSTAQGLDNYFRYRIACLAYEMVPKESGGNNKRA